jgi:hypothetical protein
LNEKSRLFYKCFKIFIKLKATFYTALIVLSIDISPSQIGCFFILTKKMFRCCNYDIEISLDIKTGLTEAALLKSHFLQYQWNKKSAETRMAGHGNVHNTQKAINCGNSFVTHSKTHGHALQLFDGRIRPKGCSELWNRNGWPFCGVRRRIIRK